MGCISLYHNATEVHDESGSKLTKLLFSILHSKIVDMLNHRCRENIEDNVHTHKCGCW